MMEMDVSGTTTGGRSRDLHRVHVKRSISFEADSKWAWIG
jgi:hypothetical protein